MAIGGLGIMCSKSITKEDITPRIICTALWRLAKVRALPNYLLEVEFIDALHGFVNMAGLIMSNKAGVFAALKYTLLFNQAYLEFGVVTWPGEIDLAPDEMYEQIKQKGTWILD